MGTYPQTAGMLEYDYKSQRSVWNISTFKKLDFIPDLDSFILDKKAKITDVISTGLISACGFLLNKKTKNILDNFQITNHEYYPAKIKYQNKINDDYYWLHFINDNFDDINFSNSSFELTHPLPFFRDESFIFQSKQYSQIIDHKSEYPDYALFPEKISLNNNLKLDLYAFEFLYNHIYINQELASALISENITGISVIKSKGLSIV